MAPTIESNTKHSYKPQIHLHAWNALVHRKGTRRSELHSNATFVVHKAVGDNNIDLWTNGSIYLQDLMIGLSPSFKNMKEFLEFTCHSEQGLHGYTKRLRAYYEAPTVGSDAANAKRPVLKLQSLLSTKECHIEQLEAACRVLQERLDKVREEYANTTSMHHQQWQRLAVDYIDLDKTCADLSTQVIEFGLEMDKQWTDHNGKLLEV